ncbi:hypothetical protein RB595_008523 [Gaeumannomyces hyphopodioides]
MPSALGPSVLQQCFRGRRVSALLAATAASSVTRRIPLSATAATTPKAATPPLPHLISRMSSSSTTAGSGKLKPAARVAGRRQDVWSIVNEAALASPMQPIVNMGQGFFGYNPPKFILDAAKAALDRVECNQYSPTKGRPRLKKAIADAYSPYWGRRLDPETEVTITTGANEGMLSAFMAFIESGDEVIVFEPFFDQYISNIEMPGGKIVYVPMHPPAAGATQTLSAGEWTVNFDELERAITPRTKMIVINTPRWLMGPAELIQHVSAAHTRICYSSVSPLQEACAVGFEKAEAEGFWDECVRDMKGRMDRFNEVWRELGVPYSEPEGGYFVMVNLHKVRLPDGYPFPPHVAGRPRDFKLAWFLIQELGVAAIPPTEFYTDENAAIVEDYLRFAVCKPDDVLELAKERLRGLKKFIQD